MGLSTFTSSRELAQLVTRFRYPLRDLAIRISPFESFDNQFSFQRVCMFYMKQGSKGKVFLENYFLSFVRSILYAINSVSYYERFSSKEGLPRINISYCYVTFRSKVFQFIDCSFLPSLLFYISISFVFPRTKKKSSSLFIPRCKRELIILSLRISPILLYAKVEKGNIFFIAK